MISSRAVLQSYLEGLLHVSGSRSATLFVPPAEYGGLLLRVGEEESLPELRDLDAARDSCEVLEPKAQAFLQEAPNRILQFGSRHQQGLLLRIPAEQGRIFDPRSTESPRRRSSDESLGGPEAVLWVGLVLDDPPSTPVIGEPAEVTLSLSGDAEHGMWPWILAVGGTLVWHEQRVSELLDDAVTGLPGRLQFQDVLDRALRRAREQDAPLTLLLINPDDFDTVNLRHGHEAGDRALAELGHILGTTLRTTDAVARYGAATFAAILPDTLGEAGVEVAEKIRQRIARMPILTELGLGCSLGVASLDPSQIPGAQPNDLIRDASRSLNAAKMAGGNQVTVWDSDAGEGAVSADRLSDIFTGDPVKDYRNMALLWGSIQVVAGSGDAETLAAEALEHLMRTLSPRSAAILAAEDDHRQLIHGVRAGAERSLLPLTAQEVGAEERATALRVEVEGRSEVLSGPHGTRLAAFPLMVDERCLGSLVITFDQSSMPFDSSDAFFLEALASQLAVALDRARLAASENTRREAETRRLEAELNQLRDALDESQLIYRSTEMEELVSTLRRVAPTDATVLITGESGTGKELLARTLHELSPRSRKTMVVVDCGSIPPTLLESELFGHEKGAYTGAVQRRVGRVAEANGSTLFLDEIGELPLEVQAKLLRFVQERQYTPVGGNRPRGVDVRIVVATNRELLSEVSAGRFREDLYYRLKVVSVEAPALRHRPDDILFLAQHFLQRYSLLYAKQVRSLTPETEALMLRYSWPGNVRELQNRIMQAVILCESEELRPDDLRLAPTETRLRPGVGPASPPAWGESVDPGTAHGAAEAGGMPELQSTDPWTDLAEVLAAEIDTVLSGDRRLLPPLGRWLGEDLVLAADHECSGNARKAAAMLSIPETTLRRRLQKARGQQLAGLAARSRGWPEVQAILQRIVKTPEAGVSFERTQKILLRLVVEREPRSKRRGAALVGVTTPTYQRRLESLRAEAASLEASEPSSENGPPTEQESPRGAFS